MPSRRRIAAALVAAALLGAPAGAAGQATTLPDEGSDVSSQPPVQLEDGARTQTGRLPDTGTDPRALFAAGVALVLIGVGLRLRTADADLY